MAIQLEAFLKAICGSWYNDYIYYKLRLYSRPKLYRLLVRLLFLPLSLGVIINKNMRNLFILPRIEMPITTRCTLRCRDCANLIPFYQYPMDTDITELIRDIDDFMGNVDMVRRFIVIGGEPFLHPDLNQLLIHLIKSNKINMVHFFTNATVVLKEDVIALLQNRKVIVTVSSYPEEIARNKNHFIEILANKNISYIIDDIKWSDLGGFSPQVDTSEAALKDRFANCSRSGCHNLVNGEYHLCPRSGHGGQIGHISIDPTDYVSFRERYDRQDFQAELRKLYTKEYITACTKCLGDSGAAIPRAIQLSRD